MSVNEVDSAPATPLATRTEGLQAELARQLPPPVWARLNAEITAHVNERPGTAAPRAGDEAPAFTLPDFAGHSWSLRELADAGPLAIVFYRGDWCPYCDLQLRAYQEVWPRIRAAGARLVAISPQTAAYCRITADKRSLDFPLLSDAGNQVARRYGLVFTVSPGMRALLDGFGVDLARFNGDGSGELPVPGTFVVARGGRIDYAHVDADYRRRLEPAELVRRLERLG